MKQLTQIQREVLASAARVLTMTRLGERDTATDETKLEQQLRAALVAAASPLVGVSAEPELAARHPHCLFGPGSDRPAPISRVSTEGRCMQCTTSACGPTRCL